MSKESTDMTPYVISQVSIMRFTNFSKVIRNVMSWSRPPPLWDCITNDNLRRYDCRVGAALDLFNLFQLTIGLQVDILSLLKLSFILVDRKSDAKSAHRKNSIILSFTSTLTILCNLIIRHFDNRNC